MSKGKGERAVAAQANGAGATPKGHFRPTEAMASAARHGLKLREKFGRGGTEVGVARANQLAAREPCTPRDVKSMHSYFARHEIDKQVTSRVWGSDSNPSAGYIAWLLWGGDAGKEWADRNAARLREK